MLCFHSMDVCPTKMIIAESNPSCQHIGDADAKEKSNISKVIPKDLKGIQKQKVSGKKKKKKHEKHIVSERNPQKKKQVSQVFHLQSSTFHLGSPTTGSTVSVPSLDWARTSTKRQPISSEPAEGAELFEVPKAEKAPERQKHLSMPRPLETS